MQANPSYVILLYPNSTQRKVRILSEFTEFYHVNQYINGNPEKPTHFLWPDSHLRKPTPKLIKWIQTDFKQMFDPNPFLWMASVGSVDQKLQPYLKDLFK